MAGTIDFTFTGEASGTLDGTSFSATNLVITGAYETESIYRRSTTSYAVLVDWISFAISGMSVVTVNDPVILWVGNSSRVVGLNNNGTFGLFQAQSLDYFGNWFLSTPIGPVTTASGSIDSGSGSTQTTGGVLILTGFASPGTFTATAGTAAIPEPASFALAGLGLAVAALIRRRSL
jgi:hypothetical protein